MQGAGGLGGLLSESSSQLPSPSSYYPTYDGNGNISEYLTHTGTLAAHYKYDPFGNTVVNTDTGNLFTYRFSTKPRDPETGLYYYGYRYYDPMTGRWPSRDPIEEKGGVNLYGFVGNDGADNWDILGEAYISMVLPAPGILQGGLAGETVAIKSEYVGKDTISESNKKCCAEVTEAKTFDLTVRTKIIQNAPTGITQNGLLVVGAHEARRRKTYKRAYDSYWAGVAEEAKNSNKLCCKDPGQAKKKLEAYIKDLREKRVAEAKKYLTSENNAISGEMGRKILDKQGNMDGIKDPHEVSQPPVKALVEIATCD